MQSHHAQPVLFLFARIPISTTASGLIVVLYRTSERVAAAQILSAASCNLSGQGLGPILTNSLQVDDCGRITHRHRDFFLFLDFPGVLGIIQVCHTKGWRGWDPVGYGSVTSGRDSASATGGHWHSHRKTPRKGGMDISMTAQHHDTISRGSGQKAGPFGFGSATRSI